MKNLLVLTAALSLAAGCKKKNNDTPPPPSSGSGSAGSGSDMGSGSAGNAAPSAADAAKVERGAYIAQASACLICHTGMGPAGPDLEHPGAGGLEMHEKMGVWRTPNITPDKGTGIGNWTDDQIIAAVREGVRPDGTKLIPMMPYMNYNVLTDDDAHALVAFLHTLKPVERTVAKSEMKMAEVPAPKPANKTPGADPVEQGAYYSSLMLCSHCHWTPKKDFSGPVDLDHMFSGGLPMEFPPLGKGTLFSKNITSDPETGIGKWSEEQIFTTIKTMQRPDGTLIRGPMLLMQGAWSQMKDADLKSVAAFIKKLPPIKNKVPAGDFVPNAGPPGGPGGPGAGSDAPKGPGGTDTLGSAAAGSGAATGSAAAAGSAAKK